MLLRCVLALFSAFVNDPLVNINVLAWICLVLIVILFLVQVYKKFLLNVLETMYLVCLLLAALFSVSSDTPSDETNAVLWMVFCSAFLIISYHIYRHLHHHTLVQRLARVAIVRVNSFKCHSANEGVVNHDASYNASENLSASQIRKLNAELREPLLEPEVSGAL